MDVVKEKSSSDKIVDINRKAKLFEQRMTEGDYLEWWVDFYLERERRCFWPKVNG